MKRLAALTLFCGILALNPGTAQDQKATPPTPAPPKPQRAVYPVANGDAPSLAEVIGPHFKGEATVIAAPGNALLVSGTAETLPEVLKLLEQLDKKPRTVEVEVTIAEVPAKDWKETEAKVEDMLKDSAGKAGAGQRIKLTAVEGQLVSAQSGGSKPYVSGTTLVGGGGGFGGKGGGGPGVAQKSISYREVGTLVKMTARVGADDAVALELNVQDTRVRAADAGDEAAAPAVETNTLTTKVSVPAGTSVVAQAVRTEGKGGATVAVVIVTARVVPLGPPKRK